MSERSELANQLNSQSLDNVLPEAFKQVGGRVFPDSRSFQPLLDLVAIVDAYRATHLLAYGGVIPNSGTAYATTLSGDGLNEVLAPAATETIQINALSVTNTGGAAPVVCNLLLGDTLLANVTVGPSESTSLSQLMATGLPMTLSKGQSLAAIKVSGTSADITVNVSAVKCSI
tara:strand:- start:150 stop:668 length:519 start_codon:yes stop_codon:yes gene_type:complete